MPKREVKVTAWLIVIALLAYGLSHTELMLKLKSSMQVETVPDGLLNFGTMGKILKQLGLVRAIPGGTDQRAKKKRQKKKYRPGNTAVQINIETDKETIFKIYWAAEGLPFSEQRSSAIKVRPAKSRYTIFIADLLKIQRLRIDPAKTSAKMRFHSISIESGMHQNITLNTREGFQGLKSVHGVRGIVYDDWGMAFETDGEDPQFELAITPKRNIETIVFQKKRLKGGYQYSANPDGFKGFPSSRVIKQDYFKTGWPILSIVANQSDLYHPDSGIIVNKTERGRAWERPVYWSFFQGGEVRSAGMAGMRMHGGRARLQLFNNFRLYFRKEYGTSKLPPGVLFTNGSEPLKRLVVHSTKWPPDWPFNTPLAFDITRQMGAIAPKTQLSTLYLNGKHQGIYFLTPQLGRVQLKSYFGHDNFDLYSFKKKNSKAAQTFYNDNFWRYANSQEKLAMKTVGQKIDLDNFTRHLFSFVFCGTSDFCQGVAVKDNSKQDGKLFWMNWDMDHSFIDVYRTFHCRDCEKIESWEQSAWSRVYNRTKQICGRERLFTRLMDEDPEYRRYVIKLVMEVLNHRINERFLNQRLDYYRRLLAAYGGDNTGYIEKLDQFFKNRAAFIRAEMKQIFGMGEIATCEVKGGRGVAFEIDGFVEREVYIGYYPKNSKIQIAINGRQKGKLLHWKVNGERVEGEQLLHIIKSDSVIEPVFKNRENR